MDPHKVLGVEDGASKDELRAKYRELVRQYHPDRFVQGSEEQIEAARLLPEINAAYEILTKTSARIAHERSEARRRAGQERANANGTSRSAQPEDVEPSADPNFNYRSAAASEFIHVAPTKQTSEFWTASGKSGRKDLTGDPTQSKGGRRRWLRGK